MQIEICLLDSLCSCDRLALGVALGFAQSPQKDSRKRKSLCLANFNLNAISVPCQLDDFGHDI